MLATFFISGTAATSIGYKEKDRSGIAEQQKGRRTAGQVIANAGVAALCGLSVIIWPDYTVCFQLALAGSLAAASADTLSSELGNVYGSRYYNIITFKKDKRGLDGVVSLEGTIAGVAGSVLLAIVYYIFFGNIKYFLFIIIAGVMGTLADSVLGATAERKGIIGNNTVNFLNTLTGELICICLYLISRVN